MQWANRRLSGPAFDIWSAGDRPWEGVTFDLARALLNLFREAPHRRAPTRLAPSMSAAMEPSNRSESSGVGNILRAVPAERTLRFQA
jgi:hypothetical protein